MDEVRKHFRPEFINRVDEIVVFHALDEKNIGAIAKIQLALVNKRLQGMEMSMEVSDAAFTKLPKPVSIHCSVPVPLKRAIQNQVENPLSKYILEGRFGPKDTILVDERNGNLVFDKKSSD